MRLRPITAIGGVLVLGAAAAFVGLWLVQSSVDRAPPHPVSSPVAAASVAAFRAGFVPLLEQATADAQVLVATGESRERNILRIRAEQEAMSGSLNAADAWVAAHQPSTPDEPAIAAYRHGAAAIRKAMSEAEAGFLRFDFARVASATETLAAGTASLQHALELLEGK